MKKRYPIFTALWTLATLIGFLFLFTTAQAQDTEGMKGGLDYWIERTEATIDSLTAAGEMEEIISCYTTILNTLRVARSQLDSIDALREYGPPE